VTKGETTDLLSLGETVHRSEAAWQNQTYVKAERLLLSMCNGEF